MSDRVVLDGDLSLSNVLDGQGGVYSRYDWRGYSAYEVAVQEGFVGTKAEWLASLQGATGPKGDQGVQGQTGPQGPKGDNGDDYVLTEQDKQDIAELIDIPVNDVAETIADVTTEEDLESFTINTDHFGEAFRLKFAKIYIQYPPSTTGTTSWTFVIATGHRLSDDANYDYTLPTLQISTSGLKALHFFKSTCGIVEQYSFYDNTLITKTLSAIRTYNTMDLVDYITAVKLVQYNGTSSMIPAGTKITIQGIRA